MTSLHSPFAIPNPIDIRAGIARPRRFLGSPHVKARPPLFQGGSKMVNGPICRANGEGQVRVGANPTRPAILPPSWFALSGQAPAGASASAFLFL